MNTQTPIKAVAAKAPRLEEKAKPKQKPKPMGPAALKGSPEARKLAAVILEVLCGLRGPGDAAKAMGIALPRYYVLETRALQGLINALEPLPRGPARNADAEIAALNRQLSRQQQELARAQFLHRAAQRTLGLPAPAIREEKTLASGKKRKSKRPSVRALKAVAALKVGLDSPHSPALEAVNSPQEAAPRI